MQFKQRLEAYVNAHGGKIIDVMIDDTKTAGANRYRITVQCAKGHTWTTGGGMIYQHSWCRECAYVGLRNKNRVAQSYYGKKKEDVLLTPALTFLNQEILQYEYHLLDHRHFLNECVKLCYTLTQQYNIVVNPTHLAVTAVYWGCQMRNIPTSQEYLANNYAITGVTIRSLLKRMHWRHMEEKIRWDDESQTFKLT
jgi:hypothetical protein